MDTKVIESMWEALWPKAFELAKLLVLVLLIWIIGKKLIKVCMKILKTCLERGKVEPGVATFLTSIVRALLYVILVLTIAGILGIETTSVVAIVGSAGLAVGLALQGSLSNFAGGVLILILKPFELGDYIVVGGNEGTVTQIEIFYTKLLTNDNRCIVLPNGSLSNSILTNVSGQKKRRFDIAVTVAGDSDIEKVKAVLVEVAKNNALVLKDEAPVAFVNEVTPAAIKMGLRCWADSQKNMDALWELREEIKVAFEKNGITSTSIV